MSAYILDRKHFVAIAKFIDVHSDKQAARTIHVYHPDLAATSYRIQAGEAATLLLLGNMESVAYRYKEMLADFAPITDREWYRTAALEPVQMFGVLRSLQYQSCEVADYEKTVAYAILIQVLWLAGAAAAELAGAEAWA
jgi:hypothetical protein